MFDFILVLVLLACAIAALSITLTRARILKPLRDWTQPRSYLAFKLISCPYCMSHWLAAGLAVWVQYTVTGIAPVDWLIAMFTLVGLSALLEGGMMNLLHMQENYIQELEDEQEQLRMKHRNPILRGAPEEVRVHTEHA